MLLSSKTKKRAKRRRMPMNKIRSEKSKRRKTLSRKKKNKRLISNEKKMTDKQQLLKIRMMLVISMKVGYKFDHYNLVLFTLFFY